MTIEKINATIASFNKRFANTEIIPGTPEMNARNSQLEVIDMMIAELIAETGKKFVVTENGLIEK